MFSEPVVGEKFFGRQEVLELLNRRSGALKEGYRQNVALTGQSLSGKSSIILEFLHAAQGDGFIPVYMEVIREPLKSFAQKFIATMLYNALHRIGERPAEDMSRLLDQAQRHLPKTSLAVKHINALIDKQEFDEAYAALLGATSTLKEETGASCIVMLDEFDNLEHLGVRNPFLAFGKVIMVQKETMYIVSSSRNEAIKKIISEKLSLLFGNFEVVTVANFHPKTAEAFLCARLGGYDIDEIMKRFLISFADGNPFYLGKLAARLKTLASERMSSYIGREAIAETILDLVYKTDGAIHQYLFSYLLELLDSKNREESLALLTAIAKCENKKVSLARVLKARQGEIAKMLVRLSESGLISKNGVFYKIEDEVLRFWLVHVYQRRKELAVQGIAYRQEVFAADISDHIADFEADAAKDPAARIAELFNLFSNELAQIDSRLIRLPHFTRVDVSSFSDGTPYVAATFRGNSWIICHYTKEVGENDIILFVKNVKSAGCKVSSKVIIPLDGIDENAKLIAKELKIAIWEAPVINMLLGFYGKRGIIRT